jgi:hypothetical protein
MSVRVLVTAFAIASMPGLGFAQSSTGQALSGAGTTSCGQYIEHSADKDISDLFVTWAQGFLSGMNVANHVITNREFVLLPDGASIKAYLDKYCRENPLEEPITGTMLLFKELREKQKAP